MVILFVAKDSDEFDRYRTSLWPHGNLFSWHLNHSDVNENTPKFPLTSSSSSVPMTKEQWIAQANKNQIQDTQQPYIRRFCQTNITYVYSRIETGWITDHVFVLDSIPEKDEAKKAAMAAENADFPDGYVAAYMDIFAGLVSYHLKKKVDDKEICVFIHWGEVSPDIPEKKFRYEVQTTKHKDIKTFAISTTRPSFDVGGDQIPLPGTHQEIQDMLLRFTYEDVKDVFSEYVWNGTVEMSAKVVSQVDYFLHDWLLPRLQDYALKNDMWKMAAIRSWNAAKEKHSSGGQGSCVIARDEKLIALFSHLIATGGMA